MTQEPASDLSYRQMQAQATKDRIVAAARSLMSERGWDATTMAAIAAEAGVATQTVYATFGSKLAIVDGMRQVMLRDAQIPQLLDEAASESDPRRCLRSCGRRQFDSSWRPAMT